MRLEHLSSPEVNVSPQEEVHTLTLTRTDAPSAHFQVGKIAQQTDLSVWATQGDTRVLVSLTVGPPPARADFRPLTVDYYERASAVGSIPGNFQRRELRQNDHEVRVSRLIDRALRPLFDPEERRDIQLCIQVLSVDPKLDLIGLAITAAGLAAHSSQLPFSGPLLGAAICVAPHDTEESQLVCRPAQAQESFEWVYATHREGIVMLEGGARRGLTPASTLLDALEAFAKASGGQLDQLQQFAESLTPQKIPYTSQLEVLDHPAFDQCLSDLADVLQDRDKLRRERRYNEILTELKREVGSDEGAVELTLWSLARAYLRAEALEGRRQDGRAPHELRAHRFETGLLPRAAGSCLVTRDSTQLLVSVTQGNGGDAPTYETLFSQDRPSLFCHYNFPGYATHQLRHGRAPNRREVGHGLLIQRALTPLYSGKRGRCTQLIADVLSSDGSSSMASVLGANLALAQANMPLETPLAGVSLGLVTDEDQEQAVLLLDITGDEDFYGDMDLKVVGGAEGICALQLDNKLGALPWSVIRTALDIASTAHLQLLELIQPLLTEYAPAPRVKHEVEIAPQLAKRVIGQRGSTRRGLEQEFNVEIHVDTQKNIVTIEGIDELKVQAASKRIEEIGQPLKSGETYDAIIDGLKDFGVFVSFRGHSGLVHISELRAEGGDATEHFSIGEALKVKLLGVDRRGRLKLSHLATL